MKYIFRGQFSGELAPGFVEALAGATVRLYKYHGTKYISSLAVADPRNTMMILPPGEMEGKAYSLIAETAMDADGKFVFELDEADEYSGEAFDIDLFFTTVPGRKSREQRPTLQLTLATMKPKWQSIDGNFSTAWEYCLPADMWRNIRANFDAWVICGRVVDKATETPVSGAHVHAFDADWIQDDKLGDAITDELGLFRIDYARSDFTRTPLSPFINAEDGGPDLYFKIVTESGMTLLDESRETGNRADRVDAEHFFFIDFAVESPVAVPA